MVCVEAAGVGKHPQCCACQIFGLTPRLCARAIERGPVGADADDGDRARAIFPHGAFQALPPSPELVIAQLGGRCRSSRDEVRNAAAAREQFCFLPWLKTDRCKSCLVQCRPETITGSRKMISSRRRIQPGVDAAEQDIKIGGHQITNRLAIRSSKLDGCWPDLTPRHVSMIP